MSSPVDKIKNKLGIAEVVGSYIKLEPAGLNFKAKCPFHNEKTPSFFVSPDRGSYYCFGCQAKGDIFTFVQEFEGADFKGALKTLAFRAGVPLVYEDREERNEKDRLFAVIENATFFFKKNLGDFLPAQEYISKRGVTAETVKNWSLGYAPLEWRALYSFLLSKGFSASEMEKAGLVKKGDSDVSGREPYDTFRGRFVFPISDTSGRVIAFSGRILVDDGKSAKYLNSPETVLFNKSEILYGLDKAKMEIRKKDYAILVEGQMDLIMCHQAGFTNAVASSGTALTAKHLEKIKRLSNRVVIAFDSDSAGFNASNKSAQLALSLGMEVKVAELPKGSDPAELILKDITLWKHALKNSSHIIDFYLNSLLAQKLDQRKLGKEIGQKVLPYVAMLQSNIEKGHFVTTISEKTGIKENVIWEDLKKTPMPSVASGDGSSKEKEDKKSDSTYISRKDFVGRKIISLIYWQENLEKPLVSVEELKKKLSDIVGEERFNKIYEQLSSDKSTLIFEAETYYDKSDRLQSDIKELFSNFEEDYLKEKLAEFMVELNKAEKTKDKNRAVEILEECDKISKRISYLKNPKISDLK